MDNPCFLIEYSLQIGWDRRLRNGMDLQQALDYVNEILVADIKEILGQSNSKGPRSINDQFVLNLRRAQSGYFGFRIYLPTRWVLFYLLVVPIIYGVLKK